MPEARSITLASPVSAVVGIGPRKAAALLELGIKSVGQLIAHLPMRHERLEAEGFIESLVVDSLGAARGEVTATRVVRRKPVRFEAVVCDHTGRLDVVWFNGAYLHDKIKPGDKIRVQGKVEKYGHLYRMSNPKHEVLTNRPEEPTRRDERLRPVYPASAGITSEQIEKAVQSVLPDVLGLIEDHLPEAFRKSHDLPSLAEAYRLIHSPETEGDAANARRRLAFDELFLLQAALAYKRAHARHLFSAPVLKWNGTVDKRIRARFPFELTEAQDRVVKEIVTDLQKDVPTNRLVQGDVGSGKTVVALYGLLMAVVSGGQGALMAPTELLAEQHYANIAAMLAGSNVRLALLTGSLSSAARNAIERDLASGDVDIVVGTHAVISEGVRFKRLAVAVIDEQHRFGVHQRLLLRDKGSVREPEKSADASELAGGAAGFQPAAKSARRVGNPPPRGEKKAEAALQPHVLVMTATPIPRTLAMTIFGDLDISTIDTLPPGRKKIVTRVVDETKEAEVFAYVRERLEKGEQVYVVAPAIEGEEEREAPTLVSTDGAAGWKPAAPEAAIAPAPSGKKVKPISIMDVLTGLKKPGSPLADKRLAVMHGKMSREEREGVMREFRGGAIDVLVATTVVEVGVDVPNATMMIIEDADRFGLATLHQLRGRVGRGSRGGLCVLIAKAWADRTKEAQERLAVMAETTDGFKIAQRDVEIRGFGDVIGVRQSGLPPFRVADLSRDLDLLTLARRDAAVWIEKSPALDRPFEKLLRARLLKAHGKWLGLADVG